MNSLQIVLAALFVLCASAGVYIWYRAKVLLRDRGFPVSFFERERHMKDIFYMGELLYYERDPEVQRRIRRLRTSMIILLVTNVIVTLAFLAAVLIPFFMTA